MTGWPVTEDGRKMPVVVLTNPVKSGEPLNMDVPYWMQLPTPLTDRSMRLIELPRNTWPDDFRFPGCLRCGMDDHPQAYCAVRNPIICHGCNLGGHFMDRCPLSRYSKEKEPTAYPDGNALSDPMVAKAFANPQQSMGMGGATKATHNSGDVPGAQDFRGGVDGTAPPTTLPLKGAEGEDE